MNSVGGNEARFMAEKNITGSLNSTAETYIDGDGEVIPGNLNQTAERHINGDNNMLIIMVALMVALVCVLGVDRIVRCVLRYRQRLAPETEEEMAARFAARGMNKDEVVVYKSGQDIIPTAETDCSICLGEFKEGEVVRILPRCNHGFHVNCIDKWLLLHSSCPLCRQLLVADNV